MLSMLLAFLLMGQTAQQRPTAPVKVSPLPQPKATTCLPTGVCPSPSPRHTIVFIPIGRLSPALGKTSEEATTRPKK